MFNFIKKGVSATSGGSGAGATADKDDEKEKRKREKKMRKEMKQGAGGISSSMSTEELLRLDEIRRSLKIRSRRKEKEKLPSGITADYSAEFFAQLGIDRNGAESDRGHEEVFESLNTTIETNSSIGSQNSDKPPRSSYPQKTNKAPPIPPHPPKRGILKTPRLNVTGAAEDAAVPIDSHSVLLQNTYQNESIAYQNVPPTVGNGGSGKQLATFDNNENMFDKLQVKTSPSPSAESLTDTTNSSFATPPLSMSPVGESQGFESWPRVQDFQDCNLPLPAVRLVELPPPRDLEIKRQAAPRNDYGFSLRKAICLDRSSSVEIPNLKPVIFAEPGAMGNVTGLLPGDRLIKVNGLSVEDLARETVIEMIRNSGNKVCVQVQPVSELIELSKRCMTQCENGLNGVRKTNAADDDETDRVGTSVSKCNTLRRSASTRFKSQGKSNTNGEAEDWISSKSDGDPVWLVHKGGFCLATLLKSTISLVDSNGETADKVIVELQHNGERLTVDGDDVEKANPVTLDLVEDICQLKHLNEASVLHSVRQRYANNLIHTRAGQVLLVINPMAPLSLYSEKVVSMFRGCKTEDMPPHIYSLTQSAYRAMLETRRDQSLIFMGRSGSGKTTSFKHALYYLTLVAGSVNKLLTAEKVNAINTVIEAFGNTRTCLNNNATRFTQMLSLDFDHSGQIASASMQVFLIERNRVGRKWDMGHTFHVLTHLLLGVDSHLQKELYLDHVTSDDSNPFVTLPQKLEDRQKASIEFVTLCQAFVTLGIPQSAVKSIWMVLAAIYHLGEAGVIIQSSGDVVRTQFANPTAARKASNLLGVPMEDLAATAFQISNVTVNGDNATPGNSPIKLSNDSIESAWDSLEALIVGIYSEVMAAVVNLINKNISTSAHTVASILLLDSPGFQNPASCGQQTGASLSDLRHNYLQERLQMLFHHQSIVVPKNRYAQEMIEIENQDYGLEGSASAVVSLIDKTPQSQMIRSSQRDLRQQDRRGIFWLLDEESIYPNTSDDTFLERVFNNFSEREYHTVLRRGTSSRQFILQHLQGTNPVLYSTSGWLRASRDHPAMRAATTLLQDSTKEDVTKLFVGTLGRSMAGIFCGSIVGLDNAQNLRRLSSIRRSFTTAGARKNALMIQVKSTVDGIIDTLRRTGTHFVHCYLPHHNAGTTSIVNQQSNAHPTMDGIVNVSLLRSQIRGSQLLDAARLHKVGFPESMPLNEFLHRFGLLNDVSQSELSVETVLKNNEIDPSTYRIGPSQVFFRCGVLNQLEAKRDELLFDRIVQLQATSRGYLARRRLAQRRVQELAVRCIQRNVKAFLAVRDWPWWRLMVRVTPLLNVHRTEEQLKSAFEELQTMQAKLEKVESERNALKMDNEKLESKLSEVTCDLQEERATAHVSSERLDAEMAERMKLEKELEYQEKKMKELQDTTEKLEMELICAKSDVNGLSDDEFGENESAEGAASVYRIKYERASRELEFTKRRLQTQHEHDLEQLVGLKKQLEKKLADAYEEVEEQRQVVSQWKRKSQKMTNEINDVKMMLEEQTSRNNVLEKKQRKFDVECQALRDAARIEKQAKERLAHDKEILTAEKFSMEQNLTDTKLDLELKEEKLATMQRELEELSFAGGTEEEVAQLKRSKMDYERRNKELEEELDEMAGQIQLLEQSKLRLEMTLETMRKDARREAQQRDDELEDVRGSSYKKIKALECQLENEHEERTLLLREKHELERRLVNLEDQERMSRANEEAVNQKLRRDLRKYKALLKDSQTQLERLKADAPNKAVIRQMKNQLEDVEAARAAAVKAKQTAESELYAVQQMFEDSQRGRSEAEEKSIKMARDRIELQAQVEEMEEEAAELVKKIQAKVDQLNVEQKTNTEYEMKISELEMERKSLKEQVAELSARIENVENLNDPAFSMTSKRQELRIKELESKLELEMATKARVEIQCNRNKEASEKLHQEIQNVQHKEALSQDALKKCQRSLRELREELHSVSNKEQDNVMKRKDLEKRLELSEAEVVSLKNDLRLALQRVADLQQAMEEEDSEPIDSDGSSISDFESRISPPKSRLSYGDKREYNGLESKESRPRKSSNTSLASSTPNDTELSLHHQKQVSDNSSFA